MINQFHTPVALPQRCNIKELNACRELCRVRWCNTWIRKGLFLAEVKVSFFAEIWLEIKLWAHWMRVLVWRLPFLVFECILFSGMLVGKIIVFIFRVIACCVASKVKPGADIWTANSLLLYVILGFLSDQFHDPILQGCDVMWFCSYLAFLRNALCPSCALKMEEVSMLCDVTS